MFPGQQGPSLSDDAFDTSPAVIAIALWVVVAAVVVIVAAFSITHRTKVN
jgi:hypothetical protein